VSAEWGPPGTVSGVSDTFLDAADPYDLNELFSAIGKFRLERALTETPADRPEVEHPVELIDESPQPVTAPPLVPAGFIDGVQASLCLTHRNHRPLYMNYVAAGCVGAGASVVGLRERLSLVCSKADVEWVQQLNSPFIVDELASDSPPDLERLAVQLLGGERESLERALVEDMLAEGKSPLVLDGSLVGRPPLRQLLGVVKSTNRRYLADESVLFNLPAGWRSPRFKISSPNQPERYSCYLRLFDASDRRWSFGLVRLESFDPDLLDPLGALALDERQHPAAGDPRFDRHLASVRACEDVLRARRPAIFTLGR